MHTTHHPGAPGSSSNCLWGGLQEEYQQWTTTTVTTIDKAPPREHLLPGWIASGGDAIDNEQLLQSIHPPAPRVTTRWMEIPTVDDDNSYYYDCRKLCLTDITSIKHFSLWLRFSPPPLTSDPSIA